MNKTLQKVLEVESELKKLQSVSEVEANIKSDSIKEVEAAARDLGVHLYEPFERSSKINVYNFVYRVPKTRIAIVVEHTEEYRFQKTLVPI